MFLFLPHDMLSQEDNELPMDNNVVMSLSPLLPNFDETEFSSHHAGSGQLHAAPLFTQECLKREWNLSQH